MIQMAKKKKKREEIEEKQPVSLAEMFQSLEVDELLSIQEVDPRFKSLMIKFVHFLRKETFTISTDALLKFFQIYSEFDIFALEEMKSALKTLFVKSKDQWDTFDDLYDQFFFGLVSYREEQIIDFEKEERIQKRSTELRKTQQEKQEQLQAILNRLKETEELHQAKRKEAKQELEQNQQDCLETYEQQPLVYRRKKELNEKELNDWAKTNESYLKEKVEGIQLTKELAESPYLTAEQKTTLQPKLQQALLEFFKGNQSELLSFFNEVEHGSLSLVKQSFNQLMLENLQNEKCPELSQLCHTMAPASVKCHDFVETKRKELKKNLDRLKKQYEEKIETQEKEKHQMAQVLQQAKQSLNETNQSLQRIESSVEEEVMKEIRKTQSLEHRELFTIGKNAVQTTAKPSELLNQKIEKMSENQYETLTSYIKSNASKFRTKISRSMIQHKHQRFNYRKTMKESLKTFGIPLELYYEKPKVKKTKVVCILDVSGSCAKSSKLLLRFVYELSTVFKGGVYSYVFIKELEEVTNLFKQVELNEAIEEALKAVPRNYSDYYHALETFHENYLSEVDRHTIVLFLGDARNNKNQPGLEFLEEIQERAKATFWLNTEMKADWNQGDSVIGLYEPYMDEVYEILTTNDLIDFLEQFKLN